MLYYVYAKDHSYEPKYQLLIKKHEQAGLEHFEDSKLSLNFQSVLKMFMKILMCTIQEKIAKY